MHDVGAMGPNELPMTRQMHTDIERIARDSYSRLVAILSSRTGDIALAEDALADAFHRALTTWPEQGVPDTPEAWLLTVARNRIKDHQKSAAVSRRADETELKDKLVTLNIAEQALSEPQFPDERLKLMFVCAHPAISENVRTPLILQTILGLPVDQIARLFLVPAPTLSKRLTRAKQKIKQSVIPFEIPQQKDILAERLEAVLEAVYGTFAACMEAEEEQHDTLVSESAYLIRLLIQLIPEEPEVFGLDAIILFSAARIESRFDESGAMVPLYRQDTNRWDKRLIAEGRAMLEQASRFNRPGRFQLEALIQSVHCDRLESEQMNWTLLLQLYEALTALRPTTGALVAQAAVIGEVSGAESALAFLSTLDIQAIDQFQPYQATLAALHSRAGNSEQARSAFDKAISLTTNLSMRRYLEQQQKLML